jgi:Spore Coat Protein U domain
VLHYLQGNTKVKIMKRTIMTVALLALAGAAQAGTASANFQATVNFTSTCVISGAAPTLAFGNYTAFGAAVVATPVSISLNCSRGTAISFAGITSGTNGLFANNGLRYTLSLTGPNTTNGGVATTSSIGQPDVNAYDIGGTLLQQAGKFTSSPPLAETVSRQIQIVF